MAGTNQTTSGGLSAEDIIKYAGWVRSFGFQGSREIYTASDPKGDVAQALKKLGFKPGSLSDKFHYRKSESFSAGALGTMSAGKRVIVLPETKDILDKMCGMDITKPDHDNIKGAHIATSANLELTEENQKAQGGGTASR